MRMRKLSFTDLIIEFSPKIYKEIYGSQKGGNWHQPDLHLAGWSPEFWTWQWRFFIHKVKTVFNLRTVLFAWGAGVLIAWVARRPCRCPSARLTVRIFGTTATQISWFSSGSKAQNFAKGLPEWSIKGVVDDWIVGMVTDHKQKGDHIEPMRNVEIRVNHLHNVDYTGRDVAHYEH